MADISPAQDTLANNGSNLNPPTAPQQPLPAETPSPENEGNVAGVWAEPTGGFNEGAGSWGEHTARTWGTTNDWGVEMHIGLREDFAIRQSDHLDHLATESWARIQRAYFAHSLTTTYS